MDPSREENHHKPKEICDGVGGSKCVRANVAIARRGHQQYVLC